MRNHRFQGKPLLLGVVGIAAVAAVAVWESAIGRSPARVEPSVGPSDVTIAGTDHESMPFWTPLEPRGFGDILPLGEAEQGSGILFSNADSVPGNEPELVSGDSPETADKAEAMHDDIVVANTPAPLVRPKDATPLTVDDDATSDMLRAIIDEELPDVAEDDLEIWLEQLGDLEPDEVRFLIRQRKRHGFDLPANLDPTRDTLATVVESPASTPSRSSTDGTARWCDDSVATLEAIAHVLERNISHSRAIGYRRAVPVPSSCGQAGPHGAAMIGIRLDQSAGELLETGATFDLAIDGDGFFACRIDDTTVYSRRGDFELTDAGMLALRTRSGTAVLDAEISIPADARSMSIDEGGVVHVVRVAGGTPEEIGVVRLSVFLNAAELNTTDDGFFVATSRSGPGIPSEAGLNGTGTIRQGALEQSNVGVEDELAELARVRRAIETLAEFPAAGRTVSEDSRKGVAESR